MGPRCRASAQARKFLRHARRSSSRVAARQRLLTDPATARDPWHGVPACHHRGSAGAPRAASGWDQRPAPRRVAHASADTSRAPPPAATAVLGEHQLSRQAFVQRMRSAAAIDELTEQLRVPPRPAARASFRSNVSRKPLRLKGSCARRSSTVCPAMRTAHHATSRARCRTGRCLGSVGSVARASRCQAAESVQCRQPTSIRPQHVAAGLA